MAEGVEAAGEIEAVGDTGEINLSTGKTDRKDGRHQGYAQGSEAQYVLHACIYLLMVHRV